jgi:hypothetical protein
MLSQTPRNVQRRAHRKAYPQLRAVEAAWRNNNRERHNATSQAWKKRNPLKVRATQRLLKFDITQVEWDAQFAAQNFACAICKREDPGGKKDWCTDHDHVTGHLRGILCWACNVGLERFNDRVPVFLSAIDYLRTTQR